MKLRYQAAILIFVLLALLGTGNASCQAGEEAAWQKVDALLAQGENLQAMRLLQGFDLQGPEAEAALWRLSRTQYEMGRLEGSEQKALALFQEAEKYARAALAAAPGKSDGYKWLAIALGAQAKYTDTETQVRQSREIKTSIEKAITLNPDDDIAYLVFSRWHYKISGLGFLARTFVRMVYGEIPEASLNEAEKLLLQAIELHDRISHRYNLYKVYNRMDRDKDAKAQLEKALTLPVTFPEEAEEQAKAKRKLQEYQ